MTSNTITGKPPTKRTRKGLILTGADGRHARNDGRTKRLSLRYYDDDKRFPSKEASIVDSLWGHDGSTDIPTPAQRRRNQSGRSTRTNESAGFPFVPAERNDVAAATLARQYRVEDKSVDEFGRRIVHVSSCDAWSLRTRR